MNLFEINDAIMSLVNPETGEIDDIEKLDALEMSIDEKVIHLGRLFKREGALADACDKEIERITAIKKRSKSNQERIKSYLTAAVPGREVKDATMTMSWRSSKAVEIADDDKFIEWAVANGRTNLVTFVATSKPNKTEVKKFLEAGNTVDGAVLVERQNVQIK